MSTTKHSQEDKYVQIGHFIYQDQNQIANCCSRHHAEHLTHCVNLLPELVAALEEMQRAAHHCAMQLGVDFSTHWKSANDHCNNILARARQ